ncbi:MAG: hypothetical protein V3V20_02520 [Algisphaera sp.]
MPNSSSNALSPPKPRRGRTLAWLAGLLPLLIIVGVVAGYYKWWQPKANAAGRHAVATVGPPSPTTAKPGDDYYVFISKIEVYPHQPGGAEWDRGGGSAPDLWYQLVWQDKTVYESPVRDNGFVALWDSISVDVAEALPLLGSGRLDLASTLNQGAIINIVPEQTLEVIVYDSDPLGREKAGRAQLAIGELLEGDNTFSFEETDENAVKRIVMRLTNTDQPVANLLDALRAP